MCEDSGLEGTSSNGDFSQPRSSLRGPLILAKLVVDALEKKQQGDGEDYHAIVQQLSSSGLKPVVMHRWLQALKLCVSRLTKEFDMLVGATLRLVWYNKEPEVVELYIDYLTNLISAQTYYLKSSLQELVKILWLPSPDGESVYHNTHEALRAVLKLVPTAPSLLMPMLVRGFPFRTKQAEIQEIALRNILHVSSYCPALRDSILQLAIHQMLGIDVEVPKVEDEDEGSGDEEEGEGETQFHVELDGTNGVPSHIENNGCHGNDPQSSSTGAVSLSAVYSRKQLMSNEMADKLDVMMTVAFSCLHSLCHPNGVFVLEAAVNLLQSLLKIFEQVILPTHACCHVQFLLFRVTSYHEAFHSHFLDFLWGKFQDFNTSVVIRQCIAAYMASFVARAKFVPLSTAKLCLTIMLQWIHQYLETCSPDLMRPDIRQHGPFYSLCQAVFYIFVFRHKALLEMEGGIHFLRQLNFERVISSRLNPLKVCLPTVVEMFASLTSHHEIVFCYTILEQNKRVILSTGAQPTTTTAAAAGQQEENNILDCFFPFDPYCLKRSRVFVCPLYQEWEGTDEDTTREEILEDEDMMSSSLPGNGSYSQNCIPSSVDSDGLPFSPPN